MPDENWIDGSNTNSLALVCSDLYLQCLVLAFSSSMGRKEAAEQGLGEVEASQASFTVLSADWSSVLGSNIIAIKKIIYAVKLALATDRAEEAVTKPL